MRNDAWDYGKSLGVKNVRELMDASKAPIQVELMMVPAGSVTLDPDVAAAAGIIFDGFKATKEKGGCTSFAFQTLAHSSVLVRDR
ncbi:hypothetical protein ACFSOZ_26710 [Mesorhizobium newzealandense]|uniref:Uncharacterized protein n=1 Tax=Mesorhizobium newzealandense TaxID=1300302 RepID=A0ABW4UEV2_9HYPH